MKKLLLTLAFVVTANVGFAQDAAFKADMMKYFEVSGSANAVDMMLNKMSANIPAEKMADLKKALEVSYREFQSKQADFFMTKLTHEDVKAAIKFYESPVGKKLIATSQDPELLKMAEEWGMSLTPVIMEYMGY